MKFATNLTKLFLLPKSTEHFLLMVRDSDDVVPFCAKDFFIFHNDISGIFRFINFLGFFFQVFCFTYVVVHERIYQQLLYFFLVEPLRLLDVFRTFQLKTKSNQYNINVNYSLQTKTRLCWAQNMSFSTWLRVVKVLYHKHFWKTVFRINLISKKNLKKLLLNYTQINTKGYWI